MTGGVYLTQSIAYQQPSDQSTKQRRNNELISRLNDNFPQELRELAQWVLWRYEANGKGDLTKVPYSVAGHRASSTDPTTWSSFAQVTAIYARGGYSGVSFAVTEYDPYLGVDLDHCLKDGQLDPLRRAWVESLSSYTEITPSGEGLRVWVRAVVPGERKKNSQQDVELYDDKRFFTVTGNHFAGTPTTIKNRQGAVTALYNQLFPQLSPATDQPRNTTPITLDDQELLNRMFSARNGAAIRALWAGDLTAHGSQSEADLALCNHLAFWTGRDAERMDRFFRQSGLMRDKWDQRARSGETYGQGTINRAIDATREVYDPHRGRNDAGGGGSGGNGGERPQVDIKGTLTRARAWIKAHSFAPYIDPDFLAKDGSYRTEMTDRRVADAFLDVLEERGTLSGFISLRDLRRRAGVGVQTVRRAMARLMGWFVALSDHADNAQDGGASHWILTFRVDETRIIHNVPMEGGRLIYAKSPFTLHKATDPFNVGGNWEMRNAALCHVIGRPAVDVLIQLEGYDKPRREAWADYRLALKELASKDDGLTAQDVATLGRLAGLLVDDPQPVELLALAHLADYEAGLAVLVELGAVLNDGAGVRLMPDYATAVNRQVASLGPVALLMIDTSVNHGDLTYNEFSELTGLKYGTLHRSMVKLLGRGVYDAERAGMEKRFTLKADWLSDIEAQAHTMRTNGLQQKREIADATAVYNYCGVLLQAAPVEEQPKIEKRRERAFNRLIAAVALESPALSTKLDFTIAMRLSGVRIPQAPKMPAPGELGWQRLVELTGKPRLTADELGELQALDRALNAGVAGRYGEVLFDRPSRY